MSNSRKKFKARRDALWEQAKRNALAEVRARIGLAPDQVVFDDVLVLEIDRYLPTHAPNGEAQYGIGVREQWFSLRLTGLAASEQERRRLADSLELRRGAKRIPWGLGHGGPGRRSQHSGRKRTQRRRAGLDF